MPNKIESIASRIENEVGRDVEVEGTTIYVDGMYDVSVDTLSFTVTTDDGTPFYSYYPSTVDSLIGLIIDEVEPYVARMNALADAGSWF